MEREIQLVYDRQCPVCEFYCQRVDVAKSEGKLVRVDAREHSDILDEVTDIGLDIDAGMVLKVDDTIYYGSDAIHALALRSSQKGFVNRIAFWMFRSKRAARVLYPFLAGCRNLLLKILGRSRINNLGNKDNEKF